MRDFDDIRVGDHISFLSGFPFSSAYFGQQEGVRLIRIRDLIQSEDEIYYGGAFDTKWLVNKGDVLIGMDGDFNAVRWRGDAALLNQRILKAELRPGGAIDLGFFYYWCGPFLRQIHNRTAATTVKHLSVRDVENAHGLFPEKPFQSKVARILSTLDRTIKRANVLIVKYQQIKAGLMHDLFTQGITPEGRLRPPRSEAPHLYRESPLGWLPQEWGTASTGSCLTGIDAGKSPECPDTPATGDQWGVLKVGAVDPDGLRESENKVVEDERLHNSAFLIRGDDLLLSRANTFGLVGLVCHVKCSPRNLVLSDKTLRLHVDPSRVTKRFLFWALQSTSTRRQIQNYATGTSGSMKNIGQRSVRAIRLPRPALAEQALITVRLDAAVDSIATLRTHLAKLCDLRQGLMHDLLTGRVRVEPGTLP